VNETNRLLWDRRESLREGQTEKIRQLLRSPVAGAAGGNPQSLPERRTIQGKYQLLELLGSGGNGAVWKARGQDGDIFALKIFHRRVEGDERKRVTRELGLAARIRDPLLVRYHSTDLEEDGETHFIRMELVEGKAIRALVGWQGGEHCQPQDAARVRRWMKGTIQALAKLHEVGIIHRDLHAGNILECTDGCLKIVD
jgi:serine/threonine protein kinase